MKLSDTEISVLNRISCCISWLIEPRDSTEIEVFKSLSEKGFITYPYVHDSALVELYILNIRAFHWFLIRMRYDEVYQG